jgi:hypothetical protein
VDIAETVHADMASNSAFELATDLATDSAFALGIGTGEGRSGLAK